MVIEYYIVWINCNKGKRFQKRKTACCKARLVLAWLFPYLGLMSIVLFFVYSSFCRRMHIYWSFSHLFSECEWSIPAETDPLPQLQTRQNLHYRGKVVRLAWEFPKLESHRKLQAIIKSRIVDDINCKFYVCQLMCYSRKATEGFAKPLSWQ